MAVDFVQEMVAAVVVYVSTGWSFWHCCHHRSRLVATVLLLVWPVAFVSHTRESRGEKQRQPATGGLAGAAVFLAWLLSMAGKRDKGGEKRRCKG